MDVEKRRTASLATLIVLIILVASGWFIWANFLAFGNIHVIADAPFTVETDDGEIYNCNSSPCSIKQKTGRQNIIIYKEGLSDEVESVLVKIWKDSEVVVTFDFEPYVLEAPSYNPAIIPSTQRNYKLIFDPSINMQKLLDEENQTIIFFPERLTNAKIFASENSALILSPDGNYRVDIQAKTRKSIDSLDIEAGKWSPDGSHFMFMDAQDQIFVLDAKNDVMQLDLPASFLEIHWSHSNELVFFQGDDQINFYDSQGQLLDVIDFFAAEGSPENLYIEPDNSSLYFTIEDQGYRLVLK